MHLRGIAFVGIFFLLSARAAVAQDDKPVEKSEGGYKLKLPKAKFGPGEQLVVEWEAPKEFSNSSWIGIVPSEVAHGSTSKNDQHDVVYEYVSGKKSGSATFKAPDKPGSWDIRLNDYWTDKEVLHLTFTVAGAAVAPVEDSLDGCIKWLRSFGVSGVGSVDEAKKLTYLDLGSAKQANDDGLKLLRHLPALERLSLYANESFTVKALDHLKDCPKLYWLSIGFTKCGAGSGKPLAACKGLRWLSFYVTDVTDDDIAELAGLPLEELSLESAKRITDKAMPHVGKMTKLRSLHIGSTQVTDAGLADLKGLADLTSLQMYSCKVNTGLSHLAGMNIQSIWITGAQLTDVGVKHLADLKSLKWASLGRTSVTGASGAVFGGLPALETLLVTDSPFGDDGLEALTASRKLATLNVTGTKITDGGLQHLAKLEKLGTLYLDTTGIGDAGMSSLAGIPNLKSLYLSRTKVTDAGMADLAKAPKLETLVLNSTAVGDAGLEALGKLATLRYVYVNSTKVTDAGKKRLKELLPKCSVY